MQFDGYAGTIREAALREVADAVAWSLKGEIEQGPRLRRYSGTLQVTLQGRQAAWIGQDETNGTVYFEGKGGTTPALVRGIRTAFPRHSVARGDVCLDFEAPGAFDTLQTRIRAVKGAQVKGGYVRLPDDAQDGKTWACGVRGAVAYLRLYEAGKMKERLHLCRPDWVRCELEVRPHYAADKLAAARLEPVGFWGMAKWSQRVGSAVAEVDVPRFESTHEASAAGPFLYCARTFRRMWEEMLANGEHIEASLRQVWADDDAAQNALRLLQNKKGGALH